MKHLGALILVIVAAMAGWMARGMWERELVAARAPSISSQVKSAKNSLPPNTVLAVGPGGARPSEASQSKLSAMRQDINAGRNLGPIYARLANANPRTPEEQWLMARLLLVCGRIGDRDILKQTAAMYKAPAPEETRSKFINSLSADDPNRDRRIAAFDAMGRGSNRCDELKDVEIQRKDWRRLLEDAAAAGELKAQLDLAKDDILEQYRAQSKSGKSGLASISASQIETAKQAIASGDPYAITEGVNFLAAGYANMSLHDAQGQPIDLKAFLAAGSLLSCDAGYSCGDQHGELLQGCAMFDRCEATNLRDYTMYYSASPYTSQLIAQYEQTLRNAMTTNDWSALRFHPSPTSMPGAWLN